MKKICKITGEEFEVSDMEMELRKKLGVYGEPEISPVFRFQYLGAFWQHWNLHKRKCQRSGKDIISVFSADCPYPVWHKDEWIKNANPPFAEFDESKDIFAQMWEFFQKSAIAHNMGAGNENCEYTDDWWYCKNCYLCHSGMGNEDIRYCYRIVDSKDCQFCVFSFELELCADVINSFNCFNLIYGLSCRQCFDSAFLYDCRNCKNCLFCSNLRNKQYYIFNRQVTKEEYEAKRKEWDFRSRNIYEQAKNIFRKMMKEQAWHRALFIENCENASGDYLDRVKNCENSYFCSGVAEDVINCARQGKDYKDTLDCVAAAVNTEIVYYSSLAQDQCYDVKFGYSLIQCKFMEYCAHCFQCENCFGCCGLVGKKYHIFNKQYSKEDYEILKAKIIEKMKQTGEYGDFFPGYFAANSYDEGWSVFYWPLSKEEQIKFGFRTSEKEERDNENYLQVTLIPDRSDQAGNDLSQKAFFDEKMKRPFQIQKADIDFAVSRSTPLPNSYYITRLQENFRWMPFTGSLRNTRCGKCGIAAKTSWWSEYDGRILCERCYFEAVY